MAIIIVSGLPRSGTSLMMQMLQAGGLEILADDRRPADPDNPRGYFEYEPVKSLRTDNSWVCQAEGRVVKVISALLPHLPANLTYQIIFMQRPMPEVLASQRAMLKRLNRRGSTADDQTLAQIFARQLAQRDIWLARQAHITVLSVNYREVLQDPENSASLVARFIGLPLKIAGMAAVVDPNLYRQKLSDIIGRL